MKKMIELCDICQEGKVDTVADGRCVGCDRALCKVHGKPVEIRVALYAGTFRGNCIKILLCSRCRNLLATIRDNRTHIFHHELHSGLRAMVAKTLREALRYGNLQGEEDVSTL